MTAQEAMALRLPGFRLVPHGCHCEWTVRATTPGALWRIRELFPACPVHGEAYDVQGKR